MRSAAAVALPLLAVPNAVSAWGSLGHATVAFIAQNYVADETVTWAQKILNSDNSSYMASVASWADDYRYTSAGSFSAPFHFIDANDNPPNSCSVDYDRDCGGKGCSVSAIQNYTQRVQDTSLSATNKKQALEFLIHFLGDITQPLHDEATEVGGNDIDVTFDGTSTNLHHIWDTNMPEKYRGGYALSDAQSWADDLQNEIDSGDYSSEKEGWLNGMDLSDVVSSAMIWATDANAYVCNPVLTGGESAVENTDLGGDYYQSAIPVFNVQIAKGGYRLAAWLNLIATGSTQL